MTLRFRALLPSTRETITWAVDKVIEVARETGCPPEEMPNVEIALREALANAIIHGNGSRAEKKILLRCYGDPRAHAVLIAVRDEGPGFDPARIPDPRDSTRLELPHGRGIFLMRELMDRTQHRKGGREVVLYKEWPGRRADPARAPRARRRPSR